MKSKEGKAGQQDGDEKTRRVESEETRNEPNDQFPPEESPEEVGNGGRDLLVVIGKTVGEADVEEDAHRRERPDDAGDPPRLLNSGSVSALKEEEKRSRSVSSEERRGKKTINSRACFPSTREPSSRAVEVLEPCTLAKPKPPSLLPPPLRSCIQRRGILLLKRWRTPNWLRC